MLKFQESFGGEWLLLTNLITLALLVVISYKSGYARKQLVRFGILTAKNETPPDYWAVAGWENTLRKLDYKADIVFFGNSITYGADFGKYFPDKKIVYLGYPGDRVANMNRKPRTDAIVDVHPEKIFIMAGINDLQGTAPEQLIIKYSQLVDSIKIKSLQSRIYIQSILPINSSRYKDHVDNNKIEETNNLIQKMTRAKGCTYINLYSDYNENGELPTRLTIDGIHLKPEAYSIWEKQISQYIND